MSSHSKTTGNPAKQKNKSQGVWGPPRYATHPMGNIKTRGQSTREALSAVMSQLKEKTGDKFLPENGPGNDIQLQLLLLREWV